MKDFIKNFVSSKLNISAEEPQAIALSTLLEELFNQIMVSERNIFLEASKAKRKKDKGNGFYERSVATGIGELNLSVPRVRSGDFRPYILPPLYQRFHDSYSQLLEALMVNGYSDSAFDRFFNSVNLPYCRTEVNKIKEELKQKVEDFKSRQLPSSLLAFFIDGYITEVKIKEKVRRICLYVIVGIDFEGQKQPLGFYLMEGAESKEKWIQVMEDLIGRGLRRVLIIVSDDLTGLKGVIEKIFPGADHQLCFVHLQM